MPVFGKCSKMADLIRFSLLQGGLFRYLLVVWKFIQALSFCFDYNHSGFAIFFDLFFQAHIKLVLFSFFLVWIFLVWLASL